MDVTASTLVQEVATEVSMHVRLGEVNSAAEMVDMAASLIAARFPDMAPEDMAIDWFALMVGAALWEAVKQHAEDEKQD